MKNNLIVIILLIIIGSVVYANSLNNQFVWDDHILVEGNVFINNWSKLPDLFTSNIAAGGGEKFNSYRPLQMITYMLDYSFWGLDPVGYHITNTLLHILTALCIFWLIVILYKNTLLAFFTSLLFLVHPIQTEAIVYISGRADPLGALFILLSIIFYIKYLQFRSIGKYLIVLLCSVLALLSRETSLIIPLLIGLYHFTFKKKIRAREFLPIVGITFAYILFRLIVLSSLISPIIYSGTFVQRIPGFFVALADYLRLLLFPFGLHMEYGQKFFSIFDLQAMIGIALFTGASIYIFRRRRSGGIIFFSLGWFFITLFPSSNIFPLNAYMAEHWLYLPSIGFFLILAKAFTHFYAKKRSRSAAMFLAAILVLFYSYLTIKQNKHWKDPKEFYKRTLTYAPHSARTHLSLAEVYQNSGKTAQAIAELKKAIELRPDHAYGYNNIGNLYESIGNIDMAVSAYEKAIEIDPGYAGAYNNLGRVYYNTGNRNKAIAFYQKAIEINPNLMQTYNNLGAVYYANGNKEEAAKFFEQAINLNPNVPSVHKNLARVYQELGRKKESQLQYKRAKELSPNKKRR